MHDTFIRFTDLNNIPRIVPTRLILDISYDLENRVGSIKLDFTIYEVSYEEYVYLQNQLLDLGLLK